jgi:peptide/nickel transport system substrate-binding protein
MGIMAQAQLDAPVEECEQRPIGTGPFRFRDWTPGVAMNLTRNEDYWQIAPDGEPYPYLSAVQFRPVPNSDARLSALVQGDLNMMHTSAVSDLVDNVPNLRDAGVINTLVSDDFTETAYILLNAANEPFSERDARIAFAHAIDREKINEVANKGGAQLADGPFAPGVLGYVADTERPAYDPEKAKQMVADLKERGVDMSVEMLSTVDPSVIRSTVMTVEMLEEAGFEVELVTEEQEELINRALAGSYDASAFRNQPGEDPDMNYLWWYGKGNPINFARFDDPVINEALEKGRSEPDREVRKGYYETVHRRMAEEVYYAYNWYVPWAVLEASNVHGILGPPMPNEAAPATRLVTGHPMHGIWIRP